MHLERMCFLLLLGGVFYQCPFGRVDGIIEVFHVLADSVYSSPPLSMVLLSEVSVTYGQPCSENITVFCKRHHLHITFITV